MIAIKLKNITINPDGSVNDKNGKTIKLLSLEDSYTKEKLKVKEYR